METVTFHRKYNALPKTPGNKHILQEINCPPETLISPLHAIILHITYKYVRFGFTCVISLSISEAGRMMEYTRLQTNNVDQNKKQKLRV